MSKKLEIGKIYPLTPLQGGLLYQFIMNKESDAYILQMVCSIKGEMDKTLLETTLNILIARYDILRTVFVYEELDEPLQVVLKERTIKVHYEDLSHLNEDKKRRYLEEFKKNDRSSGLDLTKDLLIKVSLFKTGADSFKLVWCLHHIVTDGWGLEILFKDFIQIYHSLKEGKPMELDPVTPFNHYINWLEEQDKEEGLKAWKEYLEGYQLESPLEKFRLKKHDGKYRLREHHLIIDEIISNELKKIARANHVTINTIFQVIWGLLLQRYNQTNDVVFGATVSGRPPGLDGTESIVGLFINTIPVRIDTSGSTDFTQLIKEVHQKSILVRPYEYSLLADIQANSFSKKKLLDHIMVFQNFPLQKELKKNSFKQKLHFKIEDMEEYERGDYDLNLVVFPGKRFLVKVSFNSLAFDSMWVKQIITHFEKIIRLVVKNPAIALNDIRFISEIALLTLKKAALDVRFDI